MLSLIDRYWDYRSAAFAATLGCPPPEGAPALETLPISAVVLEQSLARAEDLEWIRSDWGVDIHSTAVEHRVTDFLALSDTAAMLLLYEWNRFNWLDTDGEMSESGFGTEHILHLQRQEDGTLLLLLDDYDEGPAYTHTLERLNQSNMPSALKAARVEVSNAELCVVDTGQSYDAVVEEFMAVWLEQLCSLGTDNPLRMTDAVLMDYATDTSAYTYPLPEHEFEEDGFSVYYKLAVKPVQRGSVAWWVFNPHEGEGEWTGWTILEDRNRFYLQDGVWRMGHYRDPAGPT